MTTPPPSIPKKPAALDRLKALLPADPARRKRLAWIASGIAAAVVAFFIVDSLLHEETDDAYVAGHLHYVSPRIAGTVTEVLVDDNQLVKAGDPLVRLDSDEYKALLLEAQSDYDKAKIDFDRYDNLLKNDAVSKEEWDQAKNALGTAQARLLLAQLQIDYSTISAPASGRVGRKNVEVGNRVSTGQSLLVVAEPEVWVVANFKETQLAKMKAGQAVALEVDAIPGRTFRGTVDSVSPASGNQFALLPADNATGNFTKIVQRVPVKIVFDPASTKGYEDRIRVGLSVIVRVRL